MNFKIFIIVIVVFCDSEVVSRQDTGYPDGLMADCPGMNRSTKFSKATRRSLVVVVVNPKSTGSKEKTCKISKAGADCVAKQLNLKKEKTQVIISGYMDASFSPLVQLMKQTYLSLGRNIIILEIFPVLVRTYPLAARVTKPLGEVFGEFLAELTFRGLEPENLELIGGSLGSHIASFAAFKYQQLTGRKPSRVTGLDPAGPCFRNLPSEERLNPQAAELVDVLHTNIDGFGLADPVGHVDFYANGGEFQPSMVDGFILPCFLVCSHVRAAYYWALSLKNPDKFVAIRCDSVADVRHGNCYDRDIETNVLGPKTNFSRPGIYYLPTDELPPYYLGDKGITRRPYGVNTYLTKSAPEEDLVV